MVVYLSRHKHRQIRAADEGNADTLLYSPSTRKKTRRQEAVNPKIKALTAVSSAVNMLTFRLNTIEGPINAVLNDVKKHAQSMSDPVLAQKAEAKFQRLFSSLTAAVKTIKEQLNPLVALLHSKLESKQPPSFDDVKEIAAALKESLPIIQASMRSLDPKSHKASLAQEMAKQKQYLKQLEAFMTSEGAENPEIKAKFNQAVKGAYSYLLGLEKLADPDFEDRVSQSVHRTLEEDIPAIVRAIKTLGNEFRSTEKTASSDRIRKRLQRVAKRIVLLTYLRNKS